MDRLQSQMRELLKAQGENTRDFVEEKLKYFIDTDDVDVQALKETIKDIKLAIEPDENTFKLIQGMIDINKSKLNSIEQSINELQIKDKELNDLISTANRNSKACLRVVEEDLVLNTSELIDIRRNALFSTSIDESL